MDFLKIIQHLLPRARAWATTKVEKTLRKYFEGLANSLGEPSREFVDGVYGDVFPETTRELDTWEKQFDLPNTGLVEQERRDRLDGKWKETGGQSPRYIEDTLRASGFDVFVYDPWEEPRPEPSGDPTYINPLDYLKSNTGTTTYIVECGEEDAECGEANAECGNTEEPQGYALVNKIFETEQDFVVICGEDTAECGEDGAECGNYNGYISKPVEYEVSSDPDTWPYYFYIGGSPFGDLATVDINRRDEFEALCLKICPTHVWLGILVSYS